MKVFDSATGRWHKSSQYLAADRLVKLRNTKTMWEVIDEIIKIWIESQPKQWKSHLVELGALQESRQNEYASTKDKSLRYILDIPEKIILMIRILYTPDEAPMNKDWMLKFAKRYPRFMVAQKL